MTETLKPQFPLEDPRAEQQLPSASDQRSTHGAKGGPRAVKRLGLSLLGLGVLLLGFVAYQLWGTALYEHSAQARLQQQIASSLHTTGSLPSGHSKSHPSSSSNVLISEAAPPTADPGLGAAVGLLSIPALGMHDTAIVEGTGEGQLQQGPGHYQGTPLPGEVGNVAIAGHRTTYGAPFYSLDALQPGDPINIETPQGLFQYLVVHTEVVDPSDVSVLQNSPLPELTLTTCNPRYSSNQRLVVQALLHTSIISSSFRATPRTGHAKSPEQLAGADSNSGQGSTDVAGGVLGAVLWGLGALLAAIGAVLAYRRLSGQLRWLTVPGVALGLFCLLACFQHVSLALPASF